MTQRLDIGIKSVAATLLLLSSLLLSAPALRAEIRLHAATGVQFSVAFRPSATVATSPMLSLQPPDAKELSTDSLYTIENSLQRQQANLSQLAPQPGSLLRLIGETIVHYTDHDTQALPLGSAAWNFPEACIELVSGERPAPQQLTKRSLVLTADYAATAFGGTCTVWDLTSTLGHRDRGGGAPPADQMVPAGLAIAIPPPSIVAYRDTPIQAVAPQTEQADQLTVSAQDSQPPQPDFPEPARAGDAVRPWVLAPNVAAKFRGNGFQLISADDVAKPPSAPPAVRRPSVRAGGTGFRTP